MLFPGVLLVLTVVRARGRTPIVVTVMVRSRAGGPVVILITRVRFRGLRRARETAPRPPLATVHQTFKGRVKTKSSNEGAQSSGSEYAVMDYGAGGLNFLLFAEPHVKVRSSPGSSVPRPGSLVLKYGSVVSN